VKNKPPKFPRLGHRQHAAGIFQTIPCTIGYFSAIAGLLVENLLTFLFAKECRLNNKKNTKNMKNNNISSYMGSVPDPKKIS